MTKCFYNSQGHYACSTTQTGTLLKSDTNYNIDYKALWEQENSFRPRPANSHLKEETPEWIYNPNTAKKQNTGLLFEYYTELTPGAVGSNPTKDSMRFSFNSSDQGLNTCTACGITSSNYSCQCIFNNSLAKKSSIDLSENIGNANGSLGFGLKDYQKTCVSCKLSNSYTMNCSCLNDKNIYTPSSIDMTQYLYNSNGMMTNIYTN
jgi:hypothetical protein